MSISNQKRVLVLLKVVDLQPGHFAVMAVGVVGGRLRVQVDAADERWRLETVLTPPPDARGLGNVAGLIIDRPREARVAPAAVDGALLAQERLVLAARVHGRVARVERDRETCGRMAVEVGLDKPLVGRRGRRLRLEDAQAGDRVVALGCWRARCALRDVVLDRRSESPCIPVPDQGGNQVPSGGTQVPSTRPRPDCGSHQQGRALIAGAYTLVWKLGSYGCTQ